MSTSIELNDCGLNTTLLLLSLYLTTIVSVSFGVDTILIVSPVSNPWVDAVETVTIFLEISPTIDSFNVVKLWWSPVPKFSKKSSPTEVVVPRPTKPVLPNPILTVETPIKLLEIFATYKLWVCGSENEEIPSKTRISDPPLVE